MARLPVLEDALDEDLEAEVGDGLDTANTPALPAGPRIRLGGSAQRPKSGAGTVKRSHHKAKAPGAVSRASQTRTRAPRSSADPLTEWAGEVLAAGLQFASARLTAGHAPLQRAEALGVGKSVTRLARRHLIPATVLDIDIPSDDKRDITLLITTLGRYLGRLLEQRLRPSPEQMAAMMRQARAAAQQQQMRADASAFRGPPFPGVVPGEDGPDYQGEPAADDTPDDIDALLADVARMQQAPAGSQTMPGGLDGSEPRAVPVTSPSQTASPSAPPGAIPDGFARMMAAGVLPGYSGEVDN